MQSRRSLFSSAIILILCLALNVTAAGKKHSPAHRGKRTATSKSRRIEKRRHGKQALHNARGRRRRRHSYDDVTGATSTPRATGIPSERVIEIQTALMNAGYLEGQPTGQYDGATVGAMKEFQAANNLPASGTPSALSLKKLGVSKTSNDGYAVPVKSVSVSEKTNQQPQAPDKGKQQD